MAAEEAQGLPLAGLPDINLNIERQGGGHGHLRKPLRQPLELQPPPLRVVEKHLHLL